MKTHPINRMALIVNVGMMIGMAFIYARFYRLNQKLSETITKASVTEAAPVRSQNSSETLAKVKALVSENERLKGRLAELESISGNGDVDQSDASAGSSADEE